MNAVTVNLKSIIDLTDEQFYQLCLKNSDVKFERNAQGDIIIMSPTGGETGKHNAEISADLVNWNRQTKLGICFDSSTCFKLPNGANRSPDLAWIAQDRWDLLSSQEKEVFPAIAPDFVLELMSPSDTLKDSQTKMQEYLENQVKLGWLINRKAKQVEIYRQSQPVEVLDFPTILSGEDVLPGFFLNLQSVWVELT
jgi:Uma2 family endonuclease